MDFCDTFVLSQRTRYWRETYLSPPPTLPLTPHRDFLLLHAFNYQIHHLFPELWSLISASCFLSAPKNAESWSFFHLYWFTFLINFIRDDVFFFFFSPSLLRSFSFLVHGAFLVLKTALTGNKQFFNKVFLWSSDATEKKIQWMNHKVLEVMEFERLYFLWTLMSKSTKRKFCCWLVCCCAVSFASFQLTVPFSPYLCCFFFLSLL